MLSADLRKKRIPCLYPFCHYKKYVFDLSCHYKKYVFDAHQFIATVIFSCYSSIPLDRSDEVMTTHSVVCLFFINICMNDIRVCARAIQILISSICFKKHLVIGLHIMS